MQDLAAGRGLGHTIGESSGACMVAPGRAAAVAGAVGFAPRAVLSCRSRRAPTRPRAAGRRARLRGQPPGRAGTRLSAESDTRCKAPSAGR
ncbi:hypothetical protein AZ78_2950 [Lysobacter capsici AZ78]|uniref:Uncharacterized protein n=1 Tax=Lysobacter capsici AZ78 TaxID=1444315 RepID=A0A108UA73_9GAMM|nr:hypothetical protein AZ78_2950 [Lysobacter capsici AZ78]